MTTPAAEPRPIPIHVASVAAELGLAAAASSPGPGSPASVRTVYRTVQLTAAEPAQELMAASDERLGALVMPLDADIVIGDNRADVAAGRGSYLPCLAGSISGVYTPGLAAPAFPGSASAIENPYGFPVQVVITGGTISAVTINGQLVGGGAGTYYVPAYGSISVTWSAQPSWTWFAAPRQPVLLAPFPVRDNRVIYAAAAVTPTGSNILRVTVTAVYRN
jgi:hypothetical protein